MDNTELERHNDPLVRAFLSFIENDMINNPADIIPVSADQMAKIAALTDRVIVTDKDDLG